ncbi:MAG: Cof-type HAD-IIB family hydrolase [Clostridiales bacterium]|nr:Cof-type HAD-IIB family hydrolase [Clostridiales bacterium]
MNNYRFLVATDMDYTLLMPGHPVSEANKRAITAIYDAGGCVTLATGRSYHFVCSYARELEITIPLITSNGAALSDPIKFCDVESVNIPHSTVEELLYLLCEEHVDATGYSSDGLYFFPESSREGFILNYNQSISEDIKARFIYDIDHEFNKFLLIDPSSEVIDTIKAFPDLQIVKSARNFYDIMMKGTSKGLALKKLASSLDVPITFALGDSENDISMLEAADYAVAMGGSSITEYADYITSDCESDGFAKAVFDYILPKSANGSAKS